MKTCSHPAALLEARDITCRYRRSKWPRSGQDFLAVDHATLSIDDGAFLGLVGASGSGKTTLALCLAGVEPPTSGAVHYRGTELSTMSKELRFRHRRNVAMILQEPGLTLNPRFRAWEAIAEPLVISGESNPVIRRDHAVHWMRLIGIDSDMTDKPCLEFSGGQRSRLAIARALIVCPELLILDESLSALDPPAQRHVLSLLLGLRSARSLSCVFVSHDLSVLSVVCDELAVMYRGEIVERAPTRRIVESPAHPHSRALVEAMPQLPQAWLD